MTSLRFLDLLFKPKAQIVHVIKDLNEQIPNTVKKSIDRQYNIDLSATLIQIMRRKTLVTVPAYALHKHNKSKESWDNASWKPLLFSLPYLSYYTGKYAAKKLNAV